MAEAEWLNGQVDAGGLGDVELILQRADTPISLQEETAPHTYVVPLLEKWTFPSLGLSNILYASRSENACIYPNEKGKNMLYSGSPSGGRSVTPFLLAVSVPAGHHIKKIQVYLALINTAISVSGQHTFKSPRDY